MSYFVVADDGNKYGPADVATLNQWIQEGRITPESSLQNEATGEMLRAQSVSGLVFQSQPAAAPTYGTPTPGVGPQGMQQPQGGFSPQGYAQNPYARPMGGPQAGQDDVNWGWIWFALSFVCCGFFGNIFGLIRANRAMELGHPGANAPRIANIIVLVLQVIYLIFVFAVMVPAALAQSATGR